MKTWMKWTLLLALSVALAAGGWRLLKARAERQQAATAAVTAPAGRAALALSATDLAPVAEVALARAVPVSGGLKATRSALVKARVPGELRQLLVREGDVVRAGQPIGEIDTTEFDARLRQADQTARSARAQLDIARRTLENNRALVDQGFISPTALQTSVSNEAAARANLEAAQAGVDLARKAQADARLVAPIGGIVSQRLAQPGERVALDARIVEIVDLSQLELEAAVPAEDVARIAVGAAATLSVDGLPAPVEARVARINPSTQAGTRAVMVYLSVAGGPGLRQGLFASGSIRLEGSPALAVPASAVRNDQAHPYVVAVEDGRAVQRRVQPGTAGEGRLGPDQPVEALVAVSAVAPPAGSPATVAAFQPLRAGQWVLRGSTGAVREGTALTLPGPGAPAGPAPGVAPAAAEAAAASAPAR